MNVGNGAKFKYIKILHCFDGFFLSLIKISHPSVVKITIQDLVFVLRLKEIKKKFFSILKKRFLRTKKKQQVFNTENRISNFQHED